MNAEEKLYSLMLVAEEQQKSISQALDEIPLLLDSMGHYSDRIATNHGHVLETLNSMRSSAIEVQQTFASSLPAFKKLLASEIEATLGKAYSDSTKTAKKIVESEFAPVQKKLNEQVALADTARKNLASSTRLFVFSSMLTTIIAVACIAGLGAFALWWTKTEYDKLANQYNELVSDGARIKLSKCGESNRLCVEILSDQQTIYHSTDNAHFYIVPKGY